MTLNGAKSTSDPSQGDCPAAWARRMLIDSAIHTKGTVQIARKSPSHSGAGSRNT